MSAHKTYAGPYPDARDPECPACREDTMATLTRERDAALAMVATLRAGLEELIAHVRGECPSLLSGSEADADANVFRILDALATTPAGAQAELEALRALEAYVRRLATERGIGANTIEGELLAKLDAARKESGRG